LANSVQASAGIGQALSRAWVNRVAGGFVTAVVDAMKLPVPPGGVRPGHLGLIASGRVILGDIAATAVDLSLRGWLEVESSGDGC
jgi:hypothetical protein